MTTNTTDRKTVRGVFEPGSEHWVGDGFPVRNLFPSNGLVQQMDPFLMLDYAGPVEFPPAQHPKGVGEHPHRGFETVTIAYQGAVAHRDSSGSAGVIYPGDVQWMTAASGVVHEELHEREFSLRGGMFEMVQLWVNLPAAHKMSKPGYQAIASGQIPSVPIGEGATARVIAGELPGAKGPAQTFTPINVWDLRLSPGASAALPLPAGHNASIVLLRGSVTVNGAAADAGPRLILLSREGQSAVVEASADSLLLVLTGEPIDEPVASYGPFVMNTQAEIMQAIADYRAGRMGRLS
ncbi:MAG: pirin family protein [Bryobacterales bacterium]|nr:pirin family protein [Bryobacterales bacterium]